MINYPAFRPYTNITPFTVRDGATYLLQIETLLGWIRNDLVPHIDKEIRELTENWDNTAVELISAWEQMSAALIERVELAESNMGNAVDEAEAAKVAAEAARDLAEIYASQAAELQDIAIATIASDSDSETRNVLEGLFADIATQETVYSGRLSESALDGRYVMDGEGVYYAERNGIKKSNTGVENTLAWLNWRNRVHGNSGSTLIFDTGVYTFETLPFDREGSSGLMSVEANITLKGQGPGTVIKLTGTGYGLAAVPIGRAEYGAGGYRNIHISGMTISTNDNWGSAARRNVHGLRLDGVSTATIENVRVTGFGKSGILNIDAWDMSWNNVEVLYCGTANATGSISDDAEYSHYAVDFDSNADSCNAVHVRAMRIEQAPLLLRLGRRARLMEFTDCKFESGNNPGSWNRTSKSPILIDQALEVSFQGIKVTGSQILDELLTYKPMITVIPNTEEFVTSYTYLSAVTFTNSDFITASRTSTPWYSGSGATFAGCLFARSRTSTNWAFELENDNKFVDCRIALVNSDQRTVRFGGKRNRFLNNTIVVGNGEPFNAVFSYGLSAENNVETGTAFTRGLPAALVPNDTARFIGSNVNSSVQRTRVLPLTNGGGSFSVYGASLIEFTDTISTNWTDFRHGYDGQVIRLVARSAGVTRIVFGVNVDPNNGSSLILNKDEPISLVNDGGVWRRC